MPAQLAHIAIDADDVQRAMLFYESVMGWSFVPWGPPNFYLIKGAGVHGALQERKSDVPAGRKGFDCTFAVADLEVTMDRVKAAGGTVKGSPFEIETVGKLIGIQDTERNDFIIMEYTEVYAVEIGIDPAQL